LAVGFSHHHLLADRRAHARSWRQLGLQRERGRHQRAGVDQGQIAGSSVGAHDPATVVAGRDLLGQHAERGDVGRGVARIEIDQLRRVHVDDRQLAARGVGHEAEGAMVQIGRGVEAAGHVALGDRASGHLGRVAEQPDAGKDDVGGPLQVMQRAGRRR
jgi:hypothetical protein